MCAAGQTKHKTVTQGRSGYAYGQDVGLSSLCNSYSTFGYVRKRRKNFPSGQHRAGSLLRAGADRGCGLKALPADLWPGACQTAGPKTPGARARHRSRRGVGCQFVSSVSPSLCPTFFSRVSPLRTTLHSATS